MEKNRNTLIIMLALVLFLFVGYQTFGYIYSEFLYPPKYEISIVEGDEEVIKQFRQFEGNDRIIVIENMSKQEFLDKYGKTELAEIKSSPLVRIYKYTSVKTGKVELATINVNEAIDYLTEELK
ncbi:hypothetical protein [Bacillus sp. AK128]